MFARFTAFAASALAVVTWSELAWATNDGNTALGLDLHYVAPLSPDVDVTSGAGAALRAGRRFHPGQMMLAVELVGAYQSFGGSTEARMYGLLGGLRLGYDATLRPGLFAHAGIARASFDDFAVPGLGHTAFTYDIGAFLDISLLPLLDVGAHASWNQTLESDNGNDGVRWLNVGLHGELVFDLM